MNHQKAFPRHALVSAIAAFTLGLGGLGTSSAALGQGMPQGGEGAESAPQPSTGQQPAAKAPSTSGDGSSVGAPFITDQQSSQTLASSIIDMSIHNGTGKDSKEIGKVTDLILDKDHKLAGVVIGVGGFLGIGQKDVGIPWNKVDEINPETHVAVVSMSKEALEKAPPFTSMEEKKDQEKQEQEKMKAQQSQPAGGGAGPMSAPAPASAPGPGGS